MLIYDSLAERDSQDERYSYDFSDVLCGGMMKACCSYMRIFSLFRVYI